MASTTSSVSSHTSGSTPVHPTGTQWPGPGVQTCSPAMLDALIAFWRFETAGATSVSNLGGQAEVLLGLARTDRASGANLTASAGWTTEGSPARNTYNGRGSALLPAGSPALAGNGNALTLAARIWLGGGQIQGGAAGPVAKPLQLLGLSGQYSANPTVESGVSILIDDPTPAGPDLYVRTWDGAAAVQTRIADYIAASTLLVAATFERSAGNVVVSVYLNGVHYGTQLVPAALVSPSRVTFGDMVESDGSVSQAAVWGRKLTFQEIRGLYTNLDCLLGAPPPPPPGGPAETWPLLNDDGTSALKPEWPVPRAHRHGTIATEMGHRHARRANERCRRRYSLRVRLGDARDAGILRRVLVETVHGTKWTRWRHPKDDPAGPAATAPRYRLMNAAEAELAVQRSRGGIAGDFTLELEDV